MKSITDDRDLLVEFLRDIYNAEVLQVPALKYFEDEIASDSIKKMIHRHVHDTRMQVLRIEELLDNLDQSLMEEHCRTMESMIEDAKRLVERCSEPAIKDKAIVISLQRINQCEINVYAVLVAMAESLELPGEKELLQKSLNEEQSFQKKIERRIEPVAG